MFLQMRLEYFNCVFFILIFYLFKTRGAIQGHSLPNVVKSARLLFSMICWHQSPLKGSI